MQSTIIITKLYLIFCIQLEGIRPIEKIRGPHILKDDNMIFRRAYKLNEVERVLVKVQTSNLLKVYLVKLSKGEYRST